jgi:arylformamidase
VLKAVTDDARNDVGSAPRRAWYDHADRAGGHVLSLAAGCGCANPDSTSAHANARWRIAEGVVAFDAGRVYGLSNGCMEMTVAGRQRCERPLRESEPVENALDPDAPPASRVEGRGALAALAQAIAVVAEGVYNMMLDGTLSTKGSAARARTEGEGAPQRALRARPLIDISLDLDASTYKMRSYEGFTKDMQFEIEVIKDYPGGLGQIVRGAHMRLHAGTHIDAPSHMVEGGDDIHDLPLAMFIGPAVIADVRHRVPRGGITADDMEKSIGDRIQLGDRVLLRTDINDAKFDGSMEWMESAPYLSDDVIVWFRDRRVPIVGFDFYHGGKQPGEDPTSSTSRKLHELGILTMPALKNLGAVSKARVTLIALPLKMIDVEASPVRAVVIED